MAIYFVSDVHLRLDRPARGHRLAQLVDRLTPADHLIVVGDLCDFWCAARQMPLDPQNCEGLASLRKFQHRGGRLTIQSGNHDRWLEAYYRNTLGAEFVMDAFEITSDNLRILSVHGHLLGARAWWKGVMESRPFLLGFRALFRSLAEQLESRLDTVNDHKRSMSDARHLAIYRLHADSLAERVDLVVLGHIHLTHDDNSIHPRLIVLGGWHHQTSYLRVENGVAMHFIEPDSI